MSEEHFVYTSLPGNVQTLLWKLRIFSINNWRGIKSKMLNEQRFSRKA